MPIDARRWPEVTALFGDLIELSAAKRTSRLAAITDAEIRAEVRSLLEADSSVGGRFDRAPTITTDDIVRSTTRAMPVPGARIGSWRLVRLIGEGGMGTVWEAVRDDSGFTKRAALKMMSRGGSDPVLVQRFEVERGNRWASGRGGVALRYARGSLPATARRQPEPGTRCAAPHCAAANRRR